MGIFNELCKIQQTHMKVKHIKYQGLFKPQDYLTNNMFTNEQSSLLFNLRFRSVKGFRDNLHGMYGGNYECPLCGNHTDTQENGLKCDVIIQHLSKQEQDLLPNIQYNDIFGEPHDQLTITELYQKIVSIRERLLENDQEPAHQGFSTGPCS